MRGVMFIIKVEFSIISFLLIRHAVDGCPVVAATPEQESQIIDTIQEFGRKISYAQWTNDSNLNVVLSPLSILIALNLLMHGTGGVSTSEIRQALNYANNLDECAVQYIYQNIISSLQQHSGNGVEISLNTKLFPQEGFPILDSFINISKIYYFSDVENLDYQTSAGDATDIINEWVSNSTMGKIEKLLGEPLSPTTVFVIVNVIFFNATWENKFNPHKTENGTFVAETRNITIPMMFKSGMAVPYLHEFDEGFEIIALPFVENRFSMYILKPTVESSVNGLKEIENSLNSSKLENLINRMEEQSFDVIIPRMKLSLDLNLAEVLPKTFGVNDIFLPTANFTRMTNIPEIKITKFVHKAILEVNEEGTIAAAATGIVGEVTGTIFSPTFKLDKPSLLFIGDNDTRSILFWARVMEPEPIWG